jgi:hypothetical protein
MTEKIILLAFSLLTIFWFSMNFNKKWNDIIYEKIKDNRSTWYWFRVFKIAETKENFIKFQKGLSIFVITIMVITIIILMIR